MHGRRRRRLLEAKNHELRRRGSVHHCADAEFVSRIFRAFMRGRIEALTIPSIAPAGYAVEFPEVRHTSLAFWLFARFFMFMMSQP